MALSSGEADLNASVKAPSETIGLELIMEETLSPLCVAPISLHVDVSTCKGMLFQHGGERVKHLATKQLWAQGAIEAYSIVVRKFPRGDNASDMLTRVVSHTGLFSGLAAVGFCFSPHEPLRLARGTMPRGGGGVQKESQSGDYCWARRCLKHASDPCCLALRGTG